MLYRVSRFLITILFAVGGFTLARTLTYEQVTWPIEILWSVLGLSAIVGAVIGFIVAPWIYRQIVQFTNFIETSLYKIPTQEIISGAVGAIVGLIIATLLGFSFSRVPIVGPFFPLFFSVILGYLGWSLGVKKKEELISIFSVLPRLLKDKEKGQGSGAPKEKEIYKILDTSVIIDGRIADICKTGFIDGTLVIPNFILEELRHIADSSDLLKRNRGRRGLDILNKIRKELDIKVLIYEDDPNDMEEVDSRLVRVAKELKGEIITNDFNLNKVAQLQGVKVLNINDLANAVKPVVLPGEEMTVQIIKEGKEPGQGVGYLDDGTMIVIENGKKLIGETVRVTVTSVLQTSAGRMIFAKPKEMPKEGKQKSVEQGEYQCLT
ncbi:MAG: PIN/TRAM domain-containing protein [Clostridia bacterium]|nr:PIN/TRAM domain-containing protein [Clostridia bacterium]